MVRLDSRRLAGAGVALVVAATVAWWGYGAYARWQARKAVTVLVKDASARLREVLRADLHGGAPVTAESVAGLEAQLAAVERDYGALKRLEASSLGALVEAADDYLLTSQEVVRRVATAGRARFNLGASSEALRSHMAADHGRAAWPGEAVRLRERVDRDYREYRLAAAALIELIDAFPASQDKLAAHLDPSMRIDSRLLVSVRAATLEATTRIGTEVERLTDLTKYR